MENRENYVPKREDRLSAVCAFGGKICELVGNSKKGCLANEGRSFSQTYNCLNSMTLGMVQTFQDTAVILHGPVGCGNAGCSTEVYYRSGMNSRGVAPRPFIWGSSNLDENDIINGGEKKLEAAIIKTDRNHRPAAIIVVTSCAPEIIGDNTEELVARLQKQVAAKIILANCEGFRSRITATAYDIVYNGIAKSLDLEYQEETDVIEDELALLKEQYENSRTVTIFNSYSVGRPDETELERLLNQLGLSVNFYPNFAHPDTFWKISRAALNVAICPTHDDYFLEYLKKRFGTPYILGNMPIGIKNTGAWLLDIAKVFHAEEKAEKIIEQEKAALEKALAPLYPRLKGKKVLISGGEIRAAVTGMLMKELGFELVGIRGHHYDYFGDEVYGKLISDNPGLEVNIATTQTFELVNMLNKTKPDLMLGHSGSNVWAGKLGIATLPVFSQTQSYLGYMGVFEVARRAVKVLENTSFQRNLAQNTRLPYKKDWYDRDPFTYIKNLAPE